MEEYLREPYISQLELWIFREFIRDNDKLKFLPEEYAVRVEAALSEAFGAVIEDVDYIRKREEIDTFFEGFLAFHNKIIYTLPGDGTDDFYEKLTKRFTEITQKDNESLKNALDEIFSDYYASVGEDVSRGFLDDFLENEGITKDDFPANIEHDIYKNLVRKIANRTCRDKRQIKSRLRVFFEQYDRDMEELSLKYAGKSPEYEVYGKEAIYETAGKDYIAELEALSDRPVYEGDIKRLIRKIC